MNGARYSERRLLAITALARTHRHAPTESEARLWESLRGRQLGVWFRRQVVLGRYIADFFSAEARVVVEVDGAYHGERGAADARRDAWMARQGYRVVRVRAEVVMRVAREPDGVRGGAEPEHSRVRADGA